MKVTCESCGSKYTIKDEKVRGKRVKIRCKGCKSPIVVDGTSLDGSARVATSESPAALSDAPEASVSMEPGADEPSATAPQGAFPAAGAFAAGAPAAEQPAMAPDSAAAVERWSVNLSETDSRDMTTDEIVSAWGSGIVTDDAYIYKPGFDDWKPILEVPELAALLSSKAPQVPDAFSPPAGQSPFAANVPRAAAAGRSGDLFGAAAAAGSEDDPGLSGPPPAMPNFDGKPTGARNESSVLFSLDALKAGFAGPSPVDASASRKNDDPFGLGAASGLGGLGGGFDQNQALFAPPPPEPKKPKKISLAPAAASEPAAAAALDRSKLIMIGAGVLALLVAVGGVGFALGGSSSGDKEATADSAELEKEKPTKGREGKEAAADTDESKAEKKDDEEKKSDEADDKKDEESKSDDKKDEESKSTSDEKQEDAAKSATASKTGTAKESTKSDTPTRAKDTKAAAPAGDSGAPPFNKGAAISALSSAAGSAAACKIPGGPTGSGKAIVTFAPSGRVTTANVVGGKFGGTSVGGCVASRFRRARIPAFSGSAVTVSKSFTIQ